MPPLDAQIKSNRRRSRALFGMFFLIYGALGFAVSLRFGPAAFYIFCAVAIVIVLVTLTMGDDLAVTVAHAKQLQSREECPPVWDAVEVMSIAAGQPMPRVYVSPDPAPNAFAAGKDPKQAVVCVNQGLLDILDKEELEGVVAHEMAHVRNLDVKLMTYAAVLAGGIALIAEFISYMIFWGGGSDEDNDLGIVGVVISILVVILAPIAAMLIQMSISRRREFLADASSAEFTKYPQGLASALRKLGASEVPAQTGSSATAHLCIVAPLGGKSSSLFSTHPPLEERIAKLDELAAGQIHTSRAVGVTSSY
ncbi:MAG: M48 family metalloprotease [Actinomycetes bacterium]